MHPAALTLAALALAGCQTVADLIPRNWQNASLATEAERERQFVIDNGRCKQVSVGSTPMPSASISAEPASYRVSGTATSSTGERSDYQGTVTPSRSGSSSFAQGMANGMAIRQSLEASVARSEIYSGCMYQLGWTEG